VRSRSLSGEAPGAKGIEDDEGESPPQAVSEAERFFQWWPVASKSTSSGAPKESLSLGNRWRLQ
jgi:hypothetical protein